MSIICPRCGDKMETDKCYDEYRKEDIISGLECTCCSKRVILSDMTIKEYRDLTSKEEFQRRINMEEQR